MANVTNLFADYCYGAGNETLTRDLILGKGSPLAVTVGSKQTTFTAW